MTIRPVPLQTTAVENRFPGCDRHEYEVRCGACGRFMSSVVLVVYHDAKRETENTEEVFSSAGIQIQAGVLGRCLRCKEENAQILFTA